MTRSPSAWPRAIVSCVVALLAPSAGAQYTELVSVSSAGAPGNGHSTQPVLSADARYVAFTSAATSLVPGDTNWWRDVFVRDRELQTTELVSAALGGVPADGHSGKPTISADGRFIAFFSEATNLVAGDTNGYDDIFVRDRVNGTTRRVSVASDGTEGLSLSGDPAISANGRFVTFWSWSPNLVAVDANISPDIFVHDLVTSVTELISVSTQGVQANNGSTWPSISGDGRILAFRTSATNLAPLTATIASDLIVRDRILGTTTRANVTVDGLEANADSYYSAVSLDGRWIAFNSSASNLVLNDANIHTDVFVRDLSTGTTELVSLSDGGTQCDDGSGIGGISADGRFVLFGSFGDSFVLGDWNTHADSFVRDRLYGTTQLVTLDDSGAQGAYDSAGAAITPDSLYVAIESNSVLAPNDTNLVRDVYVRYRGIPPTPEVCAGDGMGTVCPCGAGAAGRGCPNSVSATGAHLGVTGVSGTTSDSLVLLGSGMPDSAALYFQGTDSVGLGTGQVFGDGLRCAGGNVRRIGVKTNFGGLSQYPEPGDAPVSSAGSIAGPGQRTYQIWYRDAADFCTASTYNLTNGRRVTWLP